MKQEKQGITVAGSLIVDISYQIDTYPKPGMLTNIRDIKYNIGGSGNLILDLAKTDPKLPVKVSGIVGCEETGQMILDVFADYKNIDTSNVTRRGISSVTHVMNAEDTKQRTFFFYPCASDVYNESCIDWEAVDARIFHLEYLLLMKEIDEFHPKYGTNGAKILHDAQQRGMKTSIDVVSEQSSRARHIVSAALKYTDYCVINEVEAAAAAGVPIDGKQKIEESVMRFILLSLHEMGVSEWIVVHTPKAGHGYDCRAKKFVSVPSLDLPPDYIKGSTGAGDAYCSGILYGAYKNWTLEKAMHFAAASAACSLSENNGTDGLRREEQIWELEKKYAKEPYKQ